MIIGDRDSILLPDEYYHYSTRKSYVMDDHSHGFLEVNYMVHGSATYFVGGEKVVLRSRNLLVIRSMVPHRLVCRGGTGEKGTFSILGTAFSGRETLPGTIHLGALLEGSEALVGFLEELGPYLLMRNGSPVMGTLEQLIGECETLADPVYMNLLVNKLLLEIARLSQNLYSNGFDHIEEIKRVIHEEYHTIQSIQDIASRVCLNKTYIQRIFKQQAGCTILQYMTGIRMQRAAALLRDTDVNIGEIDSYIGLNSRHNFYLLFRKTYGMSPSEYRRQHREQEK